MNPLGDSREAKAGVRLGALRRPVGWGSAAALVVASMIGTGVFTTSGFLLTDLGSPWAVLAVWVAGGILATLGALPGDVTREPLVPVDGALPVRAVTPDAELLARYAVSASNEARS